MGTQCKHCRSDILYYIYQTRIRKITVSIRTVAVDASPTLLTFTRGVAISRAPVFAICQRIAFYAHMMRRSGAVTRGIQKMHTRCQAIDSSPSRWTFTLTIIFTTLAILATSECWQHAVETWRTLGWKVVVRMSRK